jgi:hypothetical protein
MLTIDRDSLHVDKRQALIHAELEKFALQVSYAKPLCKFVAVNNCVKNVLIDDEWVNVIFRLHLYQNGDNIGEIFVEKQYTRGTLALEPVYGVQSFRIEKNRGDRNTSKSKDMKVALRIAKKMFVARDENEMRELINKKVSADLGALTHHKKRLVQNCVNIDTELDLYILKAYQARKENNPTVLVPSNLVTVKNITEHDKHCEEYVHAKDLLKMYKNKQGYGIQVMGDFSLNVLDYKTNAITRYLSFDKLPEDIQSKFAMFKVLKEDEPYAHLGCKFDEGILYIAGDA